MSVKQLDFVVRGDDTSTLATVDGIPTDLWERFVAEAQIIMPEKGRDAWAAVLSEVIANIGGGGKTHTLIMTDIPLEAVEAFDDLAAQIDETPDGLVAQMYRYALARSLHLVKFVDDPGPGHVLMLYNIPHNTWEAWGAFAAQADQTAESMFGTLLQVTAQGGMKVTRRGGNGNKFVTPAAQVGAGARARRARQLPAANARPV